MSTALLLVHGRSQQMPAGIVRTDSSVADYVAAKKSGVAGRPGQGDDPRRPTRASLRTRCTSPTTATCWPTRSPNTSRPAGGRPSSRDLDRGTGDATRRTTWCSTQPPSSGSWPHAGSSRAEPEVADAARDIEKSRAAGEEASWGDLLKPKVVREALRFLSDKTGAPQLIITQFLSDVAYYLEDDAMRDEVQDVVTASLTKITDDGHSDVVVDRAQPRQLRRLRRPAALHRLRPGPPARDRRLP